MFGWLIGCLFRAGYWLNGCGGVGGLFVVGGGGGGLFVWIGGGFGGAFVGVFLMFCVGGFFFDVCVVCLFLLIFLVVCLC